jgi:chromate reductase, NAD(P)H dehydrogenase (quinone)
VERNRLEIGAIVGSLRRHSLNRLLYRALVDLAPPLVNLYEIPIGDLPHFDQDLDADPPQEVVDFRGAIRKSDGLVFVSPEYNYSIPGMVKNAIDWASWPQDRQVLSDKPAAIIGASAGRSGTMRGQLHLRQILPYCNVHLMNKPEVFLTFAGDKFDARGRVVDPVTLEQLRAFTLSLEAWVRLMAIEAHRIR